MNINLRAFIVQHFNLEELRTLCFDLSVTYDSLPGEGLDSKARELVSLMQRQGRLDELRKAIGVEAKTLLGQQPIPHNLPPRGEFVGRGEEKTQVHKALLSRSRLISIDGIGGIGKTALALEVAHECLQASYDKDSSGNIATFEGFIWITTKR